MIVDVRLLTDDRAGHIPGVINLPKDKLHILYCYSQTCHLAAEASLDCSGRATGSSRSPASGWRLKLPGELRVEP